MDANNAAADKTSGSIGQHGKWDVDFENGKLKVVVSHEGQSVEAGAMVAIPLSVLGDKIKAAIPGKFDDVMIDGLISALSLL